jgi:hypothetical protein
LNFKFKRQLETLMFPRRLPVAKFKFFSRA